LNQKELLLSYIENEQRAVRAVKRKVIYDFSCLAFSVFLSKTNVDNVLFTITNKYGDEMFVTLDTKEVEVKAPEAVSSKEAKEKSKKEKDSKADKKQK
jgi:hypothetical protein